MHGKVYANEVSSPADWRRELQRFGTKLGLPAGLAGILAVGAERPLDLWFVLFQGFSTAIAALSIARSKPHVRGNERDQWVKANAAYPLKD